MYVRALVLTSAMSASIALAAPTVSSVSGTVEQGQSITINGAGFDIKPQAAPLMFDDFESGGVGAQVHGRPGVAGTWGQGEWSGNVFYSSTQSLQGSRAAHHSFGSGIYNASLYLDPSEQQTYYLDFWMRVESKSSSLTRNFKP